MKVHLVIKENAYNGKQEFFVFSKHEKAAKFVDDQVATQSKEDWADFEIEQIKVDQEA
ncbi:MAG TPA: hypothetical protein VKR58_00360 [Aquella sp.]|nr:hypothetical protein [Aquella sp.]